MLDGTTIAAILTGILALLGALATAWMSGLNEKRTEARKNRKALARYSVPLLIASWDLANWLYDIIHENNYSPDRCNAYGEGWNNRFTSYLFGQYFAGVHIIREMTQFFAQIRGGRAEELKKLLWKIQDEFISMHYEGRENLELRWFEGDVLAVQELMTVQDESAEGGLRTMHWVEFKERYDAGDKVESKDLKKLFDWYEVEFQRIVYRRFKYLYATKWPDKENPQGYEKMKKALEDEAKGLMALEGDEKEEAKQRLGEIMEELEKHEKEEEAIENERKGDPSVVVVVPDHRVRRLQHLLSDLVRLLDEESNMKFNRPVRRCEMIVDKRVLAPGTTSTDFQFRIPCDCNDHSELGCNPDGVDFEHRDLHMGKPAGGNRFVPERFLPKRRTSTFPVTQAAGPDQTNLSRKTTEGGYQV